MTLEQQMHQELAERGTELSAEQRRNLTDCAEDFNRRKIVQERGEVTNNSPITALVDLDGTLADYTGELDRRINLMSSPNEEPIKISGFGWDDEPEYVRERMQIVKGNPGFWSKLPRLVDGFEILDSLYAIGYSIHILSKGPRYAPIGWMEKLEWCQKNIVYPHDVTVTMDKSLVYGRILVDDYPEYATRWLKWRYRGLVIMPDRPWNQGFDHPQVYRYTGNLSEMYQVLKDHYDKSTTPSITHDPKGSGL